MRGRKSFARKNAGREREHARIQKRDREDTAGAEHNVTFYGQLAAEELGGRGKVPVASYKPARDEVQAMAKVPGFRRALVFYRLNLRFEGNREWALAIRGFDDKQLLAAAEYARRSEIFDRAIFTADRTREVHDFSMRYLAPYRDVMKSYVSQQQLDEAWVYGLIRQESRFIADVK